MYNQLILDKVGCKTMMLLSLLILFLLPQRAIADDLPRIDDPSYYTIDSYGNGSLRIKMPLYNKVGEDRWVKEATLTIEKKEKDGSYSPQKQVLNVKIVDDDDISGGAKYVEYYFSSNVNGLVELVSEREHVALSSTWKKVQIHFNNDDICFAEFDWFLPVEYRGKSVRFSWQVSRNTTNHHEGSHSNEVYMDIPEKSDLMDPILTSAIISDNTKYKGEILIPWMISVNDSLIESVKYGYKDADGQRHLADLDAISSDNIRLDATGVYDSLYVVVDYWSWDEQKKAKSLVEKRMSDFYDVPTIHAPLGLETTPLYDRTTPTVRLDWHVDHPNREDLFDPDNFQVQRSLNGQEENFKDIDVELFTVGDSLYTLNDSTILESLQKSDFDSNGLLQPVYRMRRSATALWGWYGNPISITDSLKDLQMCLLTAKDAQGVIVDNDKHTLQVTWNYTQSDNVMFVWDERAEMKLLVRMRRIDGTLVDTMEVVLTPSEIQQKKKNINLPRSCVNYEILIKDEHRDTERLEGVCQKGKCRPNGVCSLDRRRRDCRLPRICGNQRKHPILRYLRRQRLQTDNETIDCCSFPLLRGRHLQECVAYGRGAVHLPYRWFRGERPEHRV